MHQDLITNELIERKIVCGDSDAVTEDEHADEKHKQADDIYHSEREVLEAAKKWYRSRGTIHEEPWAELLYNSVDGLLALEGEL